MMTGISLFKNSPNLQINNVLFTVLVVNIYLERVHWEIRPYKSKKTGKWNSDPLLSKTPEKNDFWDCKSMKICGLSEY